MSNIDNDNIKNILGDIDNHNIDDLDRFKLDVLVELNFNKKEIKNLKKKLEKYKYIEDLSDLHLGKYIRWFNIKNEPQKPKLKNGGFIIDINYINDINIICKNSNNYIFNLNFNDCIIFQKLTLYEEFISNVLSYIK